MSHDTHVLVLTSHDWLLLVLETHAMFHTEELSHRVSEQRALLHAHRNRHTGHVHVRSEKGPPAQIWVPDLLSTNHAVGGMAL